MEVRNTYCLVRHGQSEAMVADVIVSHMVSSE